VELELNHQQTLCNCQSAWCTYDRLIISQHGPDVWARRFCLHYLSDT